MLIYGYAWIDSPKFVKVFSRDDSFQNTETGDILLLEPLNCFDRVGQDTVTKNSLPFAVTVNTLNRGDFSNTAFRFQPSFYVNMNRQLDIQNNCR